MNLIINKKQAWSSTGQLIENFQFQIGSDIFQFKPHHETATEKEVTTRAKNLYKLGLSLKQKGITPYPKNKI